MRAILFPDGNLLVPVEPDDGPGRAEIGPEHPDYGTWRAVAEEGEDPRPRRTE